MTEKEKAIRQFHFVLTDKDNPALVDHMAGLAKQKQLTDEIKIAIELLAQLKKGNRELLDTLFPNLCEPTPPPPPPTPSNEDLMREIISLKQAMQQNPPAHDNSDIPDSRSTGLPAMKPAGYAPAIAAPVAVVAAAKVASAEEISDNFLNCFLQ